MAFWTKLKKPVISTVPVASLCDSWSGLSNNSARPRYTRIIQSALAVSLFQYSKKEKEISTSLPTQVTLLTDSPGEVCSCQITRSGAAVVQSGVLPISCPDRSVAVSARGTELLGATGANSGILAARCWKVCSLAGACLVLSSGAWASRSPRGVVLEWPRSCWLAMLTCP